jgi:hypothetical protein
VSHRDPRNGAWGPPAEITAPGINLGTSNDRVPTFSHDGHWLYFASNRDGTLDIWRSYRANVHDDNGWQTPEKLPAEINSPSSNEDAPTLFEDEDTGVTTFYFTSDRLRPDGTNAGFDIYVSTLNPDGSFTPAALVSELSSPGRDTRTAIRRDGLEIFITSDRTDIPGGAGGIDLWVSTRATTSASWGVPAPVVGSDPDHPINTAANDGAPALSSDGETLFFYSNRPGGHGGNDLYMATRTRAPEDDEDAGAALLAQLARHSVRQGPTALVSTGALPTANGARPFAADIGADGLATFTKVTIVGGTQGYHGASRRVVATVPLEFTPGQVIDARPGDLGPGPAQGDDGLG